MYIAMWESKNLSTIQGCPFYFASPPPQVVTCSSASVIYDGLSLHLSKSEGVASNLLKGYLAELDLVIVVRLR